MIYRELEDWDRAEDAFHQGMDIFEKIENNIELSKVYYQYGLLLKRKDEKGHGVS